jgi:hypothetical protein
MTRDERIPDLCNQLLRAKDSAVLHTVAATLKQAIDEYLESNDGEAPALDPHEAA